MHPEKLAVNLEFARVMKLPKTQNTTIAASDSMKLQKYGAKSTTATLTVDYIMH